MTVGKKNGNKQEKYRYYAMRRMNSEAHMLMKKMAAEHDCSLEAMVNYVLRVGIWTLKKVDVEPEPTMKDFQ